MNNGHCISECVCVQDKMDGFVATHFFGWWLKVRTEILHFLQYILLVCNKSCTLCTRRTSIWCSEMADSDQHYRKIGFSLCYLCKMGKFVFLDCLLCHVEIDKEFCHIYW